MKERVPHERALFILIYEFYEASHTNHGDTEIRFLDFLSVP